METLITVIIAVLLVMAILRNLTKGDQPFE